MLHWVNVHSGINTTGIDLAKTNLPFTLTFGSVGSGNTSYTLVVSIEVNLAHNQLYQVLAILQFMLKRVIFLASQMALVDIHLQSNEHWVDKLYNRYYRFWCKWFQFCIQHLTNWDVVPHSLSVQTSKCNGTNYCEGYRER